eukprot:TRINITY_DN1575_c0_g1_i6.p2 TRINITY_DN1575_c0_g1~~TRINITY_DN1575_c0_g1_i6.p2  ORF type:complete len:116 (+),score=9.72 TRINITY_DN1575_c0_g1_i6:158-505(+)
MCIRDRVSTQSTWGTKIIYEQGIKIQRGGGGYMEFSQYIADNALILIPALYIIGMLIKNIEKIADKYIPIILLVIGILGAIGLMGLSVNSAIQGVLVTGATVYVNQLIKQSTKDE